MPQVVINGQKEVFEVIAELRYSMKRSCNEKVTLSVISPGVSGKPTFIYFYPEGVLKSRISADLGYEELGDL